jgi:hypothetical protein
MIILNPAMEMKKLLLLFISTCTFNICIAQHSVSGTIYDMKTGEILPGASIIEKNTFNGTSTNSYGHFFLITTKADSLVNLVVSFLGYKQLETIVKRSAVIRLGLEPDSFSIGEVIVSDFQRTKSRLSAGHFKLNPKELKNFPAFSGETDLTTFMQLLPGVALAGDGNAAMNVRGGTSEQNLFLIDDMPLYYVNHLGGFLSTFNADIIKSVDFFKNAFPLRYGGRLSSVADIRTNDGNLHKYDIYGTVGLISSKIGIEGPVIKNKSSFLISARKNTIPIFRWLYGLNLGFNFYDTNLKLNTILSEKDRIFLSFYRGNDEVEVNNSVDLAKNIQAIAWGNTAGSARYSRILSSNLYSNVILGHTTYCYLQTTESKSVSDKNHQQFNQRFLSAISDNFLNINLEYYSEKTLEINSGFGFINHNYSPGKSSVIQYEVRQELGYPDIRANEYSFYIQGRLDDFYGFSFQGGLRTVFFSSARKNNVLPEPRIAVSKQLGKTILLKTSWDVMHQTFHLLSSPGAGIPVEFRIPAAKFAPPENSKMFSAGISWDTGFKEIQLDIDFYKKQLNNLTELKEGINFASAQHNLENTIWAGGSGTSKGLELLLRKIVGQTTGWAGAAFSKSERTFKQLNQGNPYPYNYDRPFEFKSFINHRISKKLSFSATWVYGAGTPVTLPVAQYYDLEKETVLLYGPKNSVRGAAYHRLDVSLTYLLKPKWGESEWNFSIINLYNRKNPYFYFADYDIGFNGTGKMTFYQQSLFPLLPSVSYSFKF